MPTSFHSNLSLKKPTSFETNQKIVLTKLAEGRFTTRRTAALWPDKSAFITSKVVSAFIRATSKLFTTFVILRKGTSFLRISVAVENYALGLSCVSCEFDGLPLRQ